MRRVLFVCSRNRLRSPTAEAIFAAPGIETDSAGVAPDAECVLNAEQLEWADIVFVMEKRHAAKLKQKFAACLSGKKVVCLNIPDNFKLMQPELIALLRQRVERHLR